MSRPRVWLVAAILLVVGALAAQAQQPPRVPRIGVLTFTRMAAPLQEAFRQGLRDHGYVEGDNILVEWRAAEGQPDRARALAIELVNLKVDVIVANLTPAVQAAKDATRTIPIVMSSAGDPVRTGFVAPPTRSPARWWTRRRRRPRRRESSSPSSTFAPRRPSTPHWREW